MVAWDGESELGGIGFRRSSIPLLLGAVAVTAGWTAVWAVSDHHAQLPATGSDRRDAAYGALALPWQGSATGGQWQSIGPASIGNEICCGSSRRGEYGSASGRITSLVVDPKDSRIVYAGSAGGGVWKTIEGGGSWSALTDEAASLGIGALAIDVSGRILYAGTGEDNHAEDALTGAGILKSTDGGQTWARVGTEFAGHRIGGLAIDRTVAGAQRVFAATDAGLYLSLDGGGTWSMLRSGGTSQIVQDPTQAERWWATQADFCADETGQVLTSVDGGSSWSVALTSPQKASRIGLGVGSNGVAYAAIADCGSGDPPAGNLIYAGKTTNYGAAWSAIPLSTPGLTNYFRDQNVRGQGYYDNIVAVDPGDPSHAVFGGVTMLATRDGAASFTDAGRVYTGGVIHPDFHAAVFTGPDTLYAGTDGGIWQSTKLGGAGAAGDWINLNSNLGTVQFYRGTALDAEHFLGGTQDNGSVGTLGGGRWDEYYLSDGGYTAVAAGSSTVYVESPLFTVDRTYFQIYRGDAAVGPTSFVPAGPCRDIRSDPACLDSHADFTVPFVLDPAHPGRLLAATDRVYQTLTGGLPAGPKGWSPISPRLTTGLAGDSIAVLELGPAEHTNVIVTASAFGAVFISRDGGRHWTNITANLPMASGDRDPRLVPPLPWITSVAINPKDANEIWLGMSGIDVPHLWHARLSSGGVVWTAVDGGALPHNLPVTSVVVDPADATRIYVGTINGVLVCERCGVVASSPLWEKLGGGLPNVWVSSLSLTLDGNSLVAWTHGRGAWITSLSRTATH